MSALRNQWHRHACLCELKTNSESALVPVRHQSPKHSFLFPSIRSSLVNPVTKNPLIRETNTPLLLVSVRTPEEAVAVIEGGAAIVDVKDPERGPLGMASIEMIFTIASTAKGMAGLPVSAALGEVIDWHHQPIPVLPPHLHYAKLGLSGLAAEPHWAALWQAVRNEFDVLRGRPVQWVAVAYADYQAARSPDLPAVLEAGIAAGCAAFLIDTWDKQGGRLVDLVSQDMLRQLAVRAREAGLAFALAGRVQLCDLRTVRACSPDIIAVRGAACAEGQRDATIEPSRVATFVSALQEEPAAMASITIQVNGVATTIPALSTVTQLLSSLNKNPRFLAVERNRELVPRTRHAECVLTEGDQLEIVTLVGGG